MSDGKMRYAQLDAFKAVAIVLVVIGHVNRSVGVHQPLDDIIYSFHVPFFFFLSGMTAAIQASRGRLSLTSSARGLLLPYFAWILIVNAGPRLVPATVMSALNPRAGLLWYLYTLFEMYALLWLLSLLPGSLRVWLVAVCVLLVVLPHPGGIEPFTYAQDQPLFQMGPSGANASAGLLGWRNFLWCFPFFGLGFVAMETGALRSVLSARWAWLAALGAYVALMLVSWPPTAVQAISPQSLLGSATTSASVYVWYRYLLAAAGIALSLSLLLHLSGRPLRWLAWVGQRTLGIYALHFLLIAWFPRLLQPYRPWFIVAFAIGGSLIITLAIERNPVGSTVLLGKRWQPLSPSAIVGYSAVLVAFAAIMTVLSRYGGAAGQLAVIGLAAGVAFLGGQRRSADDSPLPDGEAGQE